MNASISDTRVCDVLLSRLLCVRGTVSCLIVQKNGAGIHATHSCYWDMANDNVAMARWPSEKQRDNNSRMYAVVTVFGVSLLQQQQMAGR